MSRHRTGYSGRTSGWAAAFWNGALALVAGLALASGASAQSAADACEDAPIVGTGTFQTPFATANNEGFDAPCDPQTASPDVWLDFVPATDGTAIFNTCGLTSADTSIAVLDNCPSAGGNVLACNDDYAQFCSTVSTHVQAGHHYKVRIAKVAFGPPGLNPRVSIDLVPPCSAHAGAPANDCCASATPIALSTVTVDTTGATRDFAGECGLGSPFPDIWYAFTPTTSGNYRIRLPQNADLLDFVVMTGGCGNPTVVPGGCHASVSLPAEQTIFAADAGTRYLIRVTGRNQPELVSSFVLEPIAPPANDDCDTAQPITGFGQFNFDSTLANSSGPDDGPQCTSFGTGNMIHDVWFRWTGAAPAGEDIEVSLCGGSPLDTRLSVYVAGCNGTTPLSPVIACNDDYCLGIHTIEPLVSRVVFRPQPGLSYLFRIGSFPTDPANDVGGAPGFFAVNHVPECHVPMPQGAMVEPEPCTVGGPNTNAGCFSDTGGGPGSFTQIPCGTTTIYGSAPAGDQDWFEFTTPVDTNVTYVFHPEFQGEADLFDSTCPVGRFALAVLRFNDGCAEGATDTTTTPITAGTYHIAVVNLDPFATCDYHSHYTLTISVERCAPIGRCCTGGACAVTTQAACTSGGGSYAGDNTTCPAPEGHYVDAAQAGSFENIAATGTDIVSCGDNCGQPDVPIGFTFNYFGTPHTTIDISTNGFLTFDADFFLGSPFNSPVPGFLPHALICPLWQDYDTDPAAGNGGGGHVFYQTLGTAPNRRFVVEWAGLATEGNTEQHSTFEAVLFEGTGGIEFRYATVDTTNGPTAGISETTDVGTAIDITALGAGHTLAHVTDPNPCPAGCAADFNHTGGLTVQDIFDFLSAWFSGTMTADFNHSGALSVQDIFDFLAAWFHGC